MDQKFFTYSEYCLISVQGSERDIAEPPYSDLHIQQYFVWNRQQITFFTRIECDPGFTEVNICVDESETKSYSDIVNNTDSDTIVVLPFKSSGLFWVSDIGKSVKIEIEPGDYLIVYEIKTNRNFDKTRYNSFDLDSSLIIDRGICTEILTFTIVNSEVDVYKRFGRVNGSLVEMEIYTLE